MSALTPASYPQLMKVLASKQKIVYLCGAGASMALCNHNITWANWILAGKSYLDASKQIELEKKLGSWSSDELINAATFLLEQLKVSDLYESFMNETIGALHPVNAAFKEALKCVWRTGDLIATTNYDITIEESVDARAVSYSKPADILSIIKEKKDNSVIHLHGVYDSLHKLDDIIADNQQYEDILSNDGAQFIQNLISIHPIIIVGCGRTVEDPNLSGFLSFIIEKLGVNDIPYFYLMKKGDSLPDLPANAIPVYYGDDYDDLPEFLSEVTHLRLNRRANIRSLASINPYKESTNLTTAFGRMHFSNGFNDFVGRKNELNELTNFIDSKSKFCWWSIFGEAGIGKSRLVLELLKNIKCNWFGFFSNKESENIKDFQPFTNTLIVFDYVLGQEKKCAETIEAYLDAFIDSPYKLRFIFIERVQNAEEWTKILKRELSTENRLFFEGAEYKQPLEIQRITDNDELQYVENYLKVYLPILESNKFIELCISDVTGTTYKLHQSYKKSLNDSYQRPLYLNIFIEVWVDKEGIQHLSSAEDLLDEYLNRERKRWLSVLGNDEDLTNSFFHLLAMACAIGIFNITDVYGANYLENDCKKLINFLDKQMDKVSATNVQADLFIHMDELVECNKDDDTVIDLIMHPENQKDRTSDDDSSNFLFEMDNEERFAFSTPYLKLSADPEEVYLHMLENVGLADDEELKRLHTIHDANVAKTAALPNHAWIIEPMIPDIIKEYIVKSTVKIYDVVRFTKLARANSILGLSNFLILALSDFPDSDIFQKIAITPPDEVLNYFEYYVSLLNRIDIIKNLDSVELVLINSKPVFIKYDLELWRRIACVLSAKGNIEQFYDSAKKFIEYLKSRTELIKNREDIEEVIKAYCVGIHNLGGEDYFSEFIQSVEKLDFPKSCRFGLVLCESYRALINAKFSKGEAFTNEWYKVKSILIDYDFSEEMCDIAMLAAKDWMLMLIKKDELDELKELETYLEIQYKNHHCLSIAQVLSLTKANIYSITFSSTKKNLSDKFEELKPFLKEYPDAMDIRSAFISIAKEEYLATSESRIVPNSIMNMAQNWSFQYPKEIEFQESYFGLLCAKLEYYQTQNNRKEQNKIFKEMKRVAAKTDYSEYNESNQLQETVDILQQIYGY